jgi:hypothetical protein
MAYFYATVEIPFAPLGVNSDHIYELLNDELNNGIYEILEETVRTRRGKLNNGIYENLETVRTRRKKHKKITVNACCRIHTAFFKEEDENGRVIRYMDYNGKQIKLRMWVTNITV